MEELLGGCFRNWTWNGLLISNQVRRLNSRSPSIARSSETANSGTRLEDLPVSSDFIADLRAMAGTQIGELLVLRLTGYRLKNGFRIG